MSVRPPSVGYESYRSSEKPGLAGSECGDCTCSDITDGLGSEVGEVQDTAFLSSTYLNHVIII